jgi:hypothetical protein
MTRTLGGETLGFIQDHSTLQDTDDPVVREA